MSNKPIDNPLLNKTVDDKKSEMGKIGEDLFDQLVMRSPVNRLPERVFKDTFLPYFVGEKKFEENQELLKVWVGIAGNPGNPVDIIDEGNDVLFQIPPLYNTDFIDSAKATPIAFTGVINEYHQRVASSPNMGENFLRTVLKSTERLISTGDNHIPEYREQWQKVFEYYQVGDKTAAPKKEGNIDDSELIFD